MVEVDVFWSWAFGATFACAASGQLKRFDTIINRYFVYNILFLSLIFGPSGVYLLNRFPGWETMWLLNRFSCYDHPMIPTMFSITNVLIGVLGFAKSYHWIKSGNPLRAHTGYVIAYVAFFAILGMGYGRFLYAGNLEQWRVGVRLPYLAFFSSEVFLTLCVMGLIVGPAAYYPLWIWCQEWLSLREKAMINAHVRKMTFICVFLVSLGYVVYIFTVPSSAELERYKDGYFSYFAPLVGFWTAMAVGYTPMVLIPLAYAPTAPEKIRTHNEVPEGAIALNLGTPVKAKKMSIKQKLGLVSPADMNGEHQTRRR